MTECDALGSVALVTLDDHYCVILAATVLECSVYDSRNKTDLQEHSFIHTYLYIYGNDAWNQMDPNKE